MLSCEALLLAPPWGQLPQVLMSVLGQKAGATKSEEQAAAEDSITDGYMMESEQEYRSRLSRWSKDVVQALESPAFCWVVSVSFKCRQPLMKCMKLIKTKQAKTSNLADIVYTRAADIMGDFMASLNPGHWRTELEYIQQVGSSSPSVLAAFVILLTLTGAAEFHRRVYMQTQTYPLQLLWLVFAPWAVHCPERQRVAQHLLKQRDADLEPNTIRFRIEWQGELQVAAASGKICPRVHAFLSAVMRMWSCDTQEQEGANSMISAMVARSPNLSLPVLAARLTIKKTIFNEVSSVKGSAKGVGDRVAVRLAVKRLVHQLSTKVDAAASVQQDLARWAPPLAACLPVNAGFMPQRPEAPVDRRFKQWCGHYHPQLVRAMSFGNPLVAYCLRTEGAFLDKAWLCFNKIRKVRNLIDCRVILESGRPTSLEVSVPFSTTTSTSLLEGVHKGMEAKGWFGADPPGPMVEVFALSLEWRIGENLGAIKADVRVDTGPAILELMASLPVNPNKRAHAGSVA